MFDVQLVAATGGAQLGSQRSVRVAIVKNDSPNGLFGFMRDLYEVRETQDEFDQSRTVQLMVVRSYGTQGTFSLLS